MPPALEDQKLVLDLLIHPEAVQDAAMDDEVIALAIGEIAICRLEDARALANVDQLIALRISIVVLVVRGRLDVQHRDVLVHGGLHHLLPGRAAASRRHTSVPGVRADDERNPAQVHVVGG